MVWVDKGAVATLTDAATAALVEGATATRQRVDERATAAANSAVAVSEAGEMQRVAGALSSPTPARNAVDVRIQDRADDAWTAAIADLDAVEDAAVAAMSNAAVQAQLAWVKGAIPTGADLDEYVTPGIFEVPTFAVASSLANRPSVVDGLPNGAIGAAQLEVTSGGGVRRIQRWSVAGVGSIAGSGKPVTVVERARAADFTWSGWSVTGDLHPSTRADLLDDVSDSIDTEVAVARSAILAVPGMPSVTQEVLVSFTDEHGAATWLEATAQDGGPTDHAVGLFAKHAFQRVDFPQHLQVSQVRAIARRMAGDPVQSGKIQLSGLDARLEFPTGYDDLTPHVLVISVHGRGESDTGDMRSEYAPLLSEPGVVWGSVSMGLNWGNETGLGLLRDLYEAACERVPISCVVMHGTSMGGLGALNAVQRATIPNVAGVYLVDADTSLAAVYAAGGARATEIRAAYGIAADGSDYAQRTAGYDPLLAPVHSYRGVPVSMIASTGDAVVNAAQHSVPFADRLLSYGINTGLTLLATTGHNIADRFDPDRLKEFIIKCVGGQPGFGGD